MAHRLPRHNIITLERGHAGPIHSVVYSADGSYVLSASANRTVKLWNPKTGLCIKAYAAHAKDVLDIALPPLSTDNTRFATASTDRSVMVWDVVSGKPIKRYTGHSSRVNSVVFNQDSSVLASGSYDSTVKLWDIRSQSRAPIQTLTEAKDSIESLQISYTDLVTASVDGGIRTYDIRFGSLTLDRLPAPVTSLTITKDRNCFLASTLDSTLRLLDRESGTLLASYKGHSNTEYRLRNTLAPNDTHVLSGSEDGKVYVWDLVEGTVDLCLEGHTKAVTCLKYNPKRHELVTGDLEGTLNVWVNDTLYAEFMDARPGIDEEQPE